MTVGYVSSVSSRQKDEASERPPLDGLHPLLEVSQGQRGLKFVDHPGERIALSQRDLGGSDFLQNRIDCPRNIGRARH